jgi:hypothetical protein
MKTNNLRDVRLQVAVKSALRLGAIGFDAVKHLVLCQIEKRPPKLDLDVYPYLPKANVGTTSAASYMSLLRGRAARATLLVLGDQQQMSDRSFRHCPIFGEQLIAGMSWHRRRRYLGCCSATKHIARLISSRLTQTASRSS